MTPPRPPQGDPERLLLGIGLLAFLGVLAYSAHRSDNHFTVVSECVSAAVLLLAVAIIWWRRTRGKSRQGD